MAEMMQKPVWRILAAVLVLVVCVAVVAIVIGSAHHEREGYAELTLTARDCKAFDNAPSASYGSLIIVKSTDATEDAIVSLMKKYGGELTSRNSYNQQYQTGPRTADSVSVVSASVYGIVPMSVGDAFMNDLKTVAAQASGTLENVSYSETTGSQTVSNCLQQLASARLAAMTLDTYLAELPLIVQDNKFQSSTGMTNLNDFNNQIQGLYSQVSSGNTIIPGIQQYANKLSISVTVQDREIPTSYNPPYGVTQDQSGTMNIQR